MMCLHWAMQVFQDALDEAEHFLKTGETPRGFEMGLVVEGGDAPEDGAGTGASGGHPRNKPRDGKGVSKKDGAHVILVYIRFRSFLKHEFSPYEMVLMQ